MLRLLSITKSFDVAATSLHRETERHNCFFVFFVRFLHEKQPLNPHFMKQIFIIAALLLFASPVFSQNKAPRWHRQKRMYHYRQRKTYPLYGKVKTVESFPNIKVQIVSPFRYARIGLSRCRLFEAFCKLAFRLRSRV